MRVAAAALCLAAAAACGDALAQEQPTLEEVLQSVREARDRLSAEMEARIARFRRERDQQAELLGQAREELAAENARSDELQARFDANEIELEEMNENLRVTTGDMGELFGVVRQYAGDAVGAFNSSLVSAQLGERTALLRQLAEAGEVPAPEQLHRFHVLLVQEMVESGKVVRFGADVVAPDGSEGRREVLRVGTFNLVAADRFLKYDAANETIQELPRQPAERFRRDAARLYEADGGVVTMAVDPTAGGLLGLLIQEPSTRERVEQGGPVGYLIIGLGAVGLALGLWRLLYLSFAGVRIRGQLNADNPSRGNALGRVLSVYQAHRDADTETLELKLDEAILRETPQLERWQVALKVIAAVAPLLGLLGTVVGMIETFQQITLFGTGDPRLMASGISKALVTTMLGLVVAIPMVLLHALVAGRSKSLIEILEEQSAGIIAEQAEKQL